VPHQKHPQSVAVTHGHGTRPTSTYDNPGHSRSGFPTFQAGATGFGWTCRGGRMREHNEPEINQCITHCRHKPEHRPIKTSTAADGQTDTTDYERDRR
jgi:hypothetical protein